MILTWIFGGIAVGAVLFAIHTRKDLNEARQVCMERSEELANALGEAEWQKINNNSMVEINKKQAEIICGYQHLVISGCRNLKVKEYSLPDIPNIPKYSIAVVGQDTIYPEMSFYLKEFTADNEEDREFAIRQAEELIEIIQNF